jgi:hypothetical protein
VLAAPAPAAEAGATLESQSPAVAAAGSGGWTVPDFKPRPERLSKYPKGKARERFLDWLLQGADRRFDAPMAVEQALQAQAPSGFRAGAGLEAKDEAGDAPEAAAGPAPQARHAGAAGPGLADLTPREILASLNVNLGSRALRYILKQHGHGRQDRKSQFAPAWSGRNALEALIAQGLLDAGNAMARIRAPRHRFDRHGRYLTLCTLPGVGDYRHYQSRRATEKFIVVTELHESEDGPCHDVVNAYPVSPNRY